MSFPMHISVPLQFRTCKDNVQRRAFSDAAFCRESFRMDFNKLADDSFFYICLHLRGVALRNDVERKRSISVFHCGSVRSSFENRKDDSFSKRGFTLAGNSLVNNSRRDIVIHGHWGDGKERILTNVPQDRRPLVCSAELEQKSHLIASRLRKHGLLILLIKHPE